MGKAKKLPASKIDYRGSIQQVQRENNFNQARTYEEYMTAQKNRPHVIKTLAPDYKRISELLDTHQELIRKYKEEVSRPNPELGDVLGIMDHEILPSIERIFRELYRTWKFSRLRKNGELYILKTPHEIAAELGEYELE